jgi:hypothetical protein
MWDRLPPGLRSALLLIAIAGVVTIGNLLRSDYRPEGKTPGVFDLEVPGTARRAWYVISTYEGILMHQGTGRRPWEMFNPSIQGGGARRAYDNVRLDFAFIPCYAIALWLGCGWAASRYREAGQVGAARLGDLASILQPLAAVCDAIENIGILKMLGVFHSGVTALARDPNLPIRPERMDPWPMITTLAAGVKWPLVALGVAVFLAGIVLAAGQWIQAKWPAKPGRGPGWAVPILLAIIYAALAGYALTQLRVIEPMAMPPEPRAVTITAAPARLPVS